jgi:hypothetical protein
MHDLKRRLDGRGVLWRALVLSVLSCGVARAADQTEYLRKPPSVLAKPEQYLDIGSGQLPYDRAAALMRHVFPTEETSLADFYCVVHVLRWGDDHTIIDKSNWFVYRGRGTRTSYAGRWTPALFEGSRVYGTDRLAVLYLHVNVPAITRTAAAQEVAPQLANLKKLDGSSMTLADLLPDVGDPSPDLKSSRSRLLRAVGSHLVEASYTGAIYQIDVVKKLPAPIQNLQDALGMVQGAAASQPFVTLSDEVVLYAGDVYDIRHVPSDVTVTGKLAGTGPLDSKGFELGKQAFDNEGLYHWDVSLGIPTKSVTQLDFQTSGGEVFAKEVDSAQLLALLNVFWRPVDTKSTKLLLVPSPVVGFALSKKPLNKLLLGLSIGLNRVQVYGGRQWSQIEKPPLPAGAVTAPEEDTTEYRGDWVFGINVPVRQVIDFLKAKK